MREHLTAGRNTAIVLVTLAAVEAACPKGETISEGADRLMERYPISKGIIAGLGAVAIAHVINEIPEKYDPFHYMLFWKE